MSLTKAQDLVELAMMAARRNGVTLEDISSAFGCSSRSAQRWTQALMTAFPQTIRDIDDERRAHWRLPARAIAPLLTPTAEELAALTAAISELTEAGLLSEARIVRSLERKVRALIPQEKGARLEVDEEALLLALGHAARPGPRPATNAAVDEAIFEALKGPQRLRILYRKRDEDEARDRVVAPHGLLLGVRRYLVARDCAKGETAPLQHYRVEEIYQAEVLDESFALDPDFDIRVHAERGFGSFENQTEHGEVVWRFSPKAAPHARRFVFHPTQTLETAEDGSLLVRFQASGHLEMCWHLYSWGDHVEVLAPEALKTMTCGHRQNFPAMP
jgi:predicted DNA-binding transcriptional regulator YafY